LEAPGRVKQPDGTFQDVKMVSLGAASFSLSKAPTGDFQLSIDWPMYIIDTDRGGFDHVLPGPGDAIAARGRMELVVGAQEAAQGRARVTMPTPATVQFSGGLNL
jgi:hypothetical protein